MSVANIITRLHEADLFRSTKYTARSLLDLVDEHGQIRLTYPAALKVVELDSDVTLRTHLISLKAAGILTYHLNGVVEVTFSGFIDRTVDHEMITHRSPTRARRSKMITERSSTDAANDDPRALGDQKRSLGDQKRSLGDHPRALGDHECAENDPSHYISHAHARARVGWLVGINNQPEDLDQPTNQPETATVSESPTVTAVESAQSYALLLAIKMKGSNAKRFSDQLPFATIRQFVARWWFGRKTRGGKFDENPGIVVTWLSTPEEYPLDREYPIAMLADIHTTALTAAERASLDDDNHADEAGEKFDEMDEFERRQYWLDRAQQRGGWTGV